MSGKEKYCTTCERVVHPSQELSSFNKSWHHACFACKVCNVSLKPDTVRTKDWKALFCVRHFTTFNQVGIDTAQVDEDEFYAMSPMDIEPAAKSTSTFDESNSVLSKQSMEEVSGSNTPETWSIEQVAQWLSSIGLEMVSENFRQNEIDGLLLMSDGLDDTMLKELISQLKYRITFNSERLKLKSKQQQKSTVHTNDINATLQSAKISDTELFSSSIKNQSLAATDIQNTNMQGYRSLPAGRIGIKATCPKSGGNISNRQEKIDLKYLLQDNNCIYSVGVDGQYFNVEDYELLKKWSLCLCPSKSVKQFTKLDPTFNTLVDKTVDAQTLMEEIIQNHSLKVYVVDSLKRFHSLMDIIHILPSCNETQINGLQHKQKTEIENFLDITDTITKSVLLTTTIDSMSYESQRYFGNFIKKNDLPIPFTYYMWNKEKSFLEYKINFNLLSEIMCLTTGKYILQIGSQSTIGMGKTSMLQFIYPDKRIETLNTDGSSTLRNGCIDVIFSSDPINQNNESYIIFDVHGTINAFNEDIITSIQEYSTFQIFYVTEQDLKSNFLNSMRNYSKNTNEKPTIVIIFDSNYDNKHYSTDKIIGDIQLEYKDWKYVEWTTASPSTLWYQPDNNKKNKDLARSQRLLKSLSKIPERISTTTQQQIDCTSIFSIQSYYLTVKNLTNFYLPINHYFSIQKNLERLFNNLNDKTENLLIVTPISYFDSAIKQCERELSDNWGAPQTEIRNKRENLIRQRSNIKTINEYTAFFINLLTKCSYIELLITEKYFEKWRLQFEPILHEQLTKVKNQALKFSSQIKQLEECLSKGENFNETDKMKIKEELSNIKVEYDKQRILVTEINKKLMNIDLTIGLFCDEIMALYEYLPHLFHPENLIEDISKAFINLMLKGFAIHILRGRPLRCQSKLIEECMKFIQTTGKAPLVLTVIGEQSSAKSSLMNTTFGSNFRVSAGRCTIGIYMSIIHWKSENIIIFDTEGLLSLEETGSIFDNQMVTMAMLSSHLVLINHKGEFNSNLKDLIGMSFYAKLQINSPIKPKLLFVLRDQADLLSNKTFFRQLTQLKEQLQNDSKFLKSSIDDELDINNENVYLLPNAFSHDVNPISNISQCWRNQTFPQEILKLRNIIFNNIINTTKPQKTQLIHPSTPTNDPAYTDMTHLYTKISSNWETIDRLGPQLLECKTLYELSMMKELQTIANDIIQTTNINVHHDGENLINETLLNFSKNSFIDKNRDRIVDEFNHKLSLIITNAIEKAKNNFNDKTQRSCYLPEIKLKINKRIEPPIHSAQHLLKDVFEERLLKLLRKARIDDAQKQLLNSVQKEFDQNKTLQLNDFENQFESEFTCITNQYELDLQSSLETETTITEKILKFYNNELRCKQGETTKKNIYGLLSPIHHEKQFKEYIQKFENCLSQSGRQLQRQIEPRSGGFLKIIKSFFTGSSDKYINELWIRLKNNLRWFENNDKNESKNKKIFIEIWHIIVQKFEVELLTLINNTTSFSSNPKTVQHLFQFIEDIMNSQCIINNPRHLQKYILCLDLAVMGLSIIINEAVNKEKVDYESKLQKSRNEMKQCKDNLIKQCNAMKDSFELGKTLGKTIGKEIINEISNLLHRRIEKDIREDIVKSQFINHESIQKRAYEESISQANGENILKYIYDINRYFIELSLEEIKTTLYAVTHRHTLNFQELIRLTISKTNDLVQQGKYQGTKQLRDDIRREILNLSDLKLRESADIELYQMFSLKNIVRIPIKDTELFKKGFSSICNYYQDIEKRVADLTKNMKNKAFECCKQSISQKLGCQARCPGCGAKCSKPLPHDEEKVEIWQDPCKKCPSNKCTCKHPNPILVKTHEATHHLASAFNGMRYYKLHTPCLELCYQRWKTNGFYIPTETQANSSENEDEWECIFPIAKYYNENYSAWYNDLNKQSIEGNACNESIPPPDQRRAWMVVRHAIVNCHKSTMIDNKEYDNRLYPANVEALPEDFEPKWKDENFE